jgi:hypothetical protein
VNKRLKKEITDAGTALRKKVFELVTSQSEQRLTTLDNTKILRLHVAANTTLFNPGYINRRNTPLLEAWKVNPRPSPSPPPAVPLPQFIPDSSPDPADNSSRHKVSKIFSNRAIFLLSSLVYWFRRGLISQPPPPHRHSQGDATLVSFMDNGRMSDTARRARMEVLASDNEKSSAVKQVLMTATQFLRKMTLETGRIGWRKETNKDMEDKTENESEKGVKEEGTWEVFGEGTEEDMEA